MDALNEKKEFSENDGIQFAVGFNYPKEYIEPYIDVLMG